VPSGSSDDRPSGSNVSPELFLRSNQQQSLARAIFITGTDTGAGKTLLTALLLHHLRQRGCHALAMKPFCSGGSQDVDLLSHLQEDELGREEINPFNFEEPVAPLVAARKHRRQIALGDALRRIRRVRDQCECLLIEGSGGLMVPLGENFLVADLIASLNCPVVVAAPNRLGVINHTLLTSRVLQLYGVRQIKIALLGRKLSDLSARTNRAVLAELLFPMPVIGVPFLGTRADTPAEVKKSCKKIKKILAQVSDFATLWPIFKKSSGKLSE
jgi:dethiobiotin synthetase